jgi:hypothetical protein
VAYGFGGVRQGMALSLDQALNLASGEALLDDLLA